VRPRSSNAATVAVREHCCQCCSAASLGEGSCAALAAMFPRLLPCADISLAVYHNAAGRCGNMPLWLMHLLSMSSS
jgi:hypothetical protein